MHYTKSGTLALGIGFGLVALAAPSAETHARANIAAGKQIYHQNCSICHGVDAKGYLSTGTGTMYDPDSPEASRRVPPADLTALKEHNAGQFPAERVRESVTSTGKIAAHGTPDMPAWGHAFDSLKSNPKRLEQRLRDLTGYIESIQEGGK
jgi:mono/diheme cytochrome c family protein